MSLMSRFFIHVFLPTLKPAVERTEQPNKEMTPKPCRVSVRHVIHIYTRRVKKLL